MLPTFIIIIFLIICLSELKKANENLYVKVVKMIYFCTIIFLGIMLYINSKKLEFIYTTSISIVIISLVVSAVIGFFFKKHIEILLFILFFNFILCVSYPIGYHMNDDHYHKFDEETGKETIVRFDIKEYKSALGITIATERNI